MMPCIFHTFPVAFLDLSSPIPFLYLSYTFPIPFPYSPHTLLILSSYSLHTLLILSSYITHTLLIHSSYTLHTLLIHSLYSHDNDLKIKEGCIYANQFSSLVVNIAGMSLKNQASMGGQHHRNRWSRWIRIGGQDGSEYTLADGINISFCSPFISSSGLKIHCSSFVLSSAL